MKHLSTLTGFHDCVIIHRCSSGGGEPDEEAEGYVVSCPALAGCYSQGDTVDEALENIKEAIILCLEDLQAQNQRGRVNPKLPVISGREAIKAFERVGYQVVRQRGSHVRLRDETDPNHRPLTVPNHKTLKLGLLRKLLRDADLTVDEFTELLK
jgi:predicted RNase H-like HicB family nuclease